FGEPEIAVGAHGDPVRFASEGWRGELGEVACHGDPADLVPFALGEPEVPVRCGGDAIGTLTGVGMVNWVISPSDASAGGAAMDDTSVAEQHATARIARTNERVRCGFIPPPHLARAAGPCCRPRANGS